MLLGTGCLGQAALDGDAIRRALQACGLDRVLLVAREEAAPRRLRGVPVTAVRTPWELRDMALAAALATGTRRLVLQPPADWDAEFACRALFGLARQQPGLVLALMAPNEGPLAGPQALQLVLEDLATLKLGYWHRPALVVLAGHSDAAWLDQLGRFLVGLSLDDVCGGETGLPPGTGEVDLGRLAELTARSVDVALDAEVLPEVGLLRVAVERLHSMGFA